MKKQLYLIGVTALFFLRASAQTDSTFYYLDKSGEFFVRKIFLYQNYF
jgi:hypothetical protein